MPRRILITGITGFAGSHLAERLAGSGDEVHGIAHEPAPHPNLARVADRVHIHTADLLEADAVREVVERVRPELVYHLAGQAVPTLAASDPLAAIAINVIGTGNLAAALAAIRAAHLVAASSADVYGVPERVPVDEDASLRPMNVYAATKVAAEAVLRDLGRRGARVTILRPSNQIGPRQHPRLAASEFAKRIAEAEAGLAEPIIRHGQLDPKREFLDVRDMAAAYEAAAAVRSGAEGEGARRSANEGEVATYNVGSGTLTSVGQVLEVLRRLARVPIRAELDPERVRPGVPAALMLDSGRFRARTGWAPAYPLERSLSDTLDFWRQALASEDPALPVRASPD